MDIERIRKELEQQDVFYTVESRDTLSQLELQLNYAPGVLAVVNADRLEALGRDVHRLLPGDELLLPQYTDRNHRERLDRLYQRQVRDELHRTQRLRENRTNLVVADDKQWRSVRLYWADWDSSKSFDESPQGFEQTFPFAIVHGVEDSEVLDKRIYLNRYENLNQSRAQEDLPFKVKSFSKAHAETGKYDKTFADATAPFQESVKVPNDLMVDFCPTQKASCHPDSAEADPDSEIVKKYSAGRIASAVSQAMIARIELPHEICGEDSIPQLPNLLTWAFLQPPTIGGNPYRVAVHNGWVVDDAQKSGWFKAEILGRSATYDAATGYYKAPMKVHRSQTTINEATGQPHTLTNIINQTAWIKADSASPNVVYVKYLVEVRNDSSKEDFKRRRDQLLSAERYAEVLSLECGSYLKVWARNLDYDWGGCENEPQDHYSEALRVGMEGMDNRSARNAPELPADVTLDLERADTLTTQDERRRRRGQNPSGYNPQLFRNHTWRRERLVDGEWVTNDEGERIELPVNSADKTRGDLLYVGLYPAELIKALRLLDQPEQPGQPRELNLPVWIGATLFTGVAAFGLGKLVSLAAHRRAEKARRKGETTLDNDPDAKPSDPDWWEKRYGEAVLKFIGLFKVTDLFAILAVDGLRENFDLDKAADGLGKLYDRLGGILTNEDVDNKAKQVDLNQSDSGILEDIKHSLPEARQDAIDAFKLALEARKDTKKAFDDLVKSVKDEVNIASTYQATVNIYGHLFKYALLNPTNPYVVEEHRKAQHQHNSEAIGYELHREMSRQEGRPVLGMFQRAWGKADRASGQDLLKAVGELKKTLLDGLADEDSDTLEVSTGDIDLVQLKDTNYSPAPYGKPLPGWLAFLFWSRKIEVDGGLALNVSGRYGKAKERQSVDGRVLSDDPDAQHSGKIVEPGQEFADLLLQLGTGQEGKEAASLEVAFQLAAIWTLLAETNGDKDIPIPDEGMLKAVNDVKWGPILLDVFQYLEVRLDVTAQLQLATNFGWRLGYLFSQSDQQPGEFYSQVNDLLSDIDLNCTVNARLSVFAWSSRLAEANLARIRKEEASFLSDLKLFGKDYWDKGISVSWGISRFSSDLYRHHQNPTREVYFGDEIGVVLGYSKLEFEPDMTATFQYYNAASTPGQAQVGMVDILQLESEMFEYGDKESYLRNSTGNDSYDADIRREFADMTDVAMVKARFTINQEVELLFGEGIGDKKAQQRLVNLSDSSVKMKQFLNEIKNSEELELQCAVTPKAGDRNDRELSDDDTYRLKLPVVRRISAHRYLGNRSYLLYAVRIENFKRDQEFAWVRLYDRDAMSGNENIRFKAKKDQGAYQEWNLMRLERSPFHPPGTTNVYYVEIPLDWLDTESLKAAIDLSDKATNSLELYIQLGYYTSIDGEDYPFKVDLLEDQSYIIFPLDHPIL